MINGELLNQFSFVELWNPQYMLIGLVIIGLYLWAVGPLRAQFKDAEAISAGKKSLFISGVIITYLTLGSPLNLIAHHFLFGAHMMQQSLMFFFVPPLILLGTPAWLIRPLLQKRFVKRIFTFFTHPIIAIVLFNMILSFYHFPSIFDAASQNMALMMGYHTIIQITAFFMWWVIVCPLPEMDSLSGLLKIVYAVINGILLYPACGLLIFTDKLIYETYANAPRLISILPPVDDQQLGGVVMKLMQEGAIGITIAFLFYHWYAKERKKEDGGEEEYFDQRQFHAHINSKTGDTQ